MKVVSHVGVMVLLQEKVYREMIFVDDIADACVYLMNNYNEPEFINVGSGIDISIKELAELIKEYVGYSGELIWDTSLPNGTPKRVMDNSKLTNLGWTYNIDFKKGLKDTIQWYTDNKL